MLENRLLEMSGTSTSKGDLGVSSKVGFNLDYDEDLARAPVNAPPFDMGNHRHRRSSASRPELNTNDKRADRRQSDVKRAGLMGHTPEWHMCVHPCRRPNYPFY